MTTTLQPPRAGETRAEAPRPVSPARPGRAGRLLRGPVGDPGWARPGLLVLLAATAILYLWGLGQSGWANSFYSAAVQAGSQSWKAFFYGSSDPANSITVDKTPASLWIMALSVRVFGLSSWSILVPQALLGVATTGLLYTTVKRWSGPAAGLIAGAVAALTPVAVLMFRFNNPDALLVLLLVAAASATVRATEKASAKWLMLAGALVGFGFLTKMLQALLVVPALGLVYLVAAPTPVRKRIAHLLAALGALIVAAGWWIAIVELVPASMRPYIGGSQNNSILELVLGYNGLGRLTGNETGSVGGGGGGTGMWGATGWGRMFNSEIGGQVSWLLPAALILLAAGLVVTRRRYRTDRTRAGLLLWGGWLLVTGLTFSFMAGIFHAYYTVALAPAIGAVVGIGAAALWRRREGSAILAITLAVTAAWSYVLLKRSADFLPWLAPVVLAGGLIVAIGLLLVRVLPRRTAAVLAGAGLIVALAGPAAYAVDTAATPHTGSIPTAGPAAGGMGGPGGGAGRGGQAPGGTATGTTQGGGPGGGGVSGLLNGSTASAAMVTLLQTDAGDYTWAAATVGSNNASGYQLASGEPVMAIGGFNGTDPSPTLAQFTAYAAAGQIHYFISAGTGGGTQTGGSAAAQEIATWVAANYTATTVGSTTVYDLTS
ncbi:MAG TPA: glycosyltransferase family 39 protein [Mycobacteriales bacterium]|nr:glycosyltransferase family 39 protein [Mycobacteriales bacterium]